MSWSIENKSVEEMAAVMGRVRSGEIPIGTRDSNGYGFTLAMVAAAYGSINDLEWLIEQGEDVRAETSELAGKTTALTSAVNTEGAIASGAVRLLLHSGSNPNALSHWGETALSRACVYASHEIVRELVLAGADVNLRLINGIETQLHLLACEYEGAETSDSYYETSARCASMLLAAGADPMLSLIP